MYRAYQAQRMMWSCFSRQIVQKSTSTKERKTLVILGTGWGGYSVVRNIDKKLYDVVVISRRNHFLFTPLLASTTVGTLEFRSIIEPVRNLHFRQKEHFHLSYAMSLDLKKKQVLCESVLKPGHTYSVPYDSLVIAVGALSNTFGIPGVMENALFLKEVADARRIRNTLLSNLELSVQPMIDQSESQRLLHTVIVGGGPTGVEFGAELYDFVKEDVSRLFHQNLGDIRVTLIESNKILSAFDERLQSYAEKTIRQRPGFTLIKSTVKEVGTRTVTLADGSLLPCGMVVWSTGLSPHPFTQTIDTPRDEGGLLITNGQQKILGDPTGCVYALGDCCSSQTNPLPQTAQVAEKQGRYVANLLNGKIAADRKFDFRTMGMLAYIGRYQAITELPDIKLLDPLTGISQGSQAHFSSQCYLFPFADLLPQRTLHSYFQLRIVRFMFLSTAASVVSDRMSNCLRVIRG